MASSIRCVLLISVVMCLNLPPFSRGARGSTMFSKVTTAPAKSLPEVQPAHSAQSVGSNTLGDNAVSAHGAASERNDFIVAAQTAAIADNSESYSVSGQGLSDTRFLEGGKYFYDISNGESNFRGEGMTAESEKESDENPLTLEDNNGYGLSSQSQIVHNFNVNDLPKTGSGVSYSGTGEGISDTRLMEGGKYFYDGSNAVSDKAKFNAMDAERKSETNIPPGDSNNGYDLFSDTHGNRDFHMSGSSRSGNELKGEGLSDTRTLDGAKYFYDISADEQMNTKNPQSYGNAFASDGLKDTVSLENSKYYDGQAGNESSDIQKEDESSSAYFQNGNSEPERYVFDTMEEYEKYMENRHYKP